MSAHALDVEMPQRVARLPRDHRGYPVPWFVAFIDGKPDFRVIRSGGVEEAARADACWICGQRLGRHRAYVAGPMCAVNRTSAEPPMHRDCAVYAARACPFLTKPHMRRREHNLPEEANEPDGIMLRRNPGVALVWVTVGTKRKHGSLFDLGEPTETLWFCEGREATRAEVEESIDSGLPSLRELAEAQDAEQRWGPRAVRALEAQVARARALLPD